MSVWTWKDESDIHFHELSNHSKASSWPYKVKHSFFVKPQPHRTYWLNEKCDKIWPYLFIDFHLSFFFFLHFFSFLFFYLPAHFFIILNSLQMATVLFVFFQHFLKKWSKKIAAVDTFCMENFFFSFSHSLFTKIQKTLTGKEYKTKWWRLWEQKIGTDVFANAQL